MRRCSVVLFLQILLAGGIWGLTGVAAAADGGSYRKPDLAAFFDKLEAGQAVTVVTLGGSITMHSGGWAQKLVERMREAYPQAQVNFVNAGISGTGSNFGVFRLKRDVINVHPDLVVVEYAVNDGGVPDEACVRNLESIVTRLQGLSQTPAIVFLESASEKGGNPARHNRVASHYNLLNVETQPVMAARMAQTGSVWKDFYGDAVHPNDAGHEIYSQTLWEAMLADQQLPPAPAAAVAVSPLSDQPLILDGTLVVPNFMVDGWDYRPEKTNGWWRKYFQGSLQSGPEAGVLSVPFYGRTVGIGVLTLEGSGRLRVIVDGKMITDINAWRPNWYYSIYVYPELLKEGWHVLSLVPMSLGDSPAQVRIGYLLLESQAKAPAIPESFWATTWPESRTRAQAIATQNWRAVPTEDWLVAGTFGESVSTPWDKPAEVLALDHGIDPATMKTPREGKPVKGTSTVSWKAGEGADGWVNMAMMYGPQHGPVAYAYTRLEAEKAGTYTVYLGFDYFGELYVNGVKVKALLEPHGSALKGVPLQLDLKTGTNDVLLKLVTGSRGMGVRLEYPEAQGLRVMAP